ncbi:MAG TPA: long-chain fatty acid--CoA ligase [Jatrophihabitans sp.]|jgi:long-chain acyl-CoA synthetase|uniref:AMP-dependent synthetase/ligase n=1 Tax=Jatrophihabitans sp. TaxID=1932789 RepID=UPI002DFD02C2|nr:long-chain fatty acid--CoA ligase [Jatrophihabitans sp.]
MGATTSGSTDTTGYPTPKLSVARMFYDRVAATPHAEAYRYPTGDGWTSITWARTAETVRTTAAGLLALGIQPEQRVAIASATRIEWLYADLAIMCAGAATTAVYPSTAADDVAYILADSDTRVVFAEDDVQVAKLRAERDRLPDLIRVITFDGQPDGEWVLSLADLQALGARHLVENPTSVDEAVAAIQPEQLATLIYTSGTTGRPKGVELPHRCWTYLGAGAEAIGILRPDDFHYLWLPLSHSFGKMLAAVQLQIGFATAVDGRIDRIVDNLAVLRPTFMAGPPRIFEKVHAKVVQTVQEEGGVKLQLFTWAFGVGGQVSRARVEGRRPSPLKRVQFALADRLVLSKVRARLGGRIRFLVSGSAPLSPDIAAWFHAAGMVVIEGYALTETGGGACIGSPEAPVFGVVGPPLVGSEIRLAADGEILIRGPLVMRGYHNLPGVTGEVLAADGWLATGDIGEIDDAGRLRVTDRKKDLIKTSGGKYISPQAIEVMFKAVCPLASQMLVHADRRNYATALITLDPEALAQWGRAQGLTAVDYPSLAADPAVHAYVQSSIDELNARLNRWETIKDFRILDHDLSVEDGELTPSMKVKRKAMETKYASLLDSMYDARSRG